MYREAANPDRAGSRASLNFPRWPSRPFVPASRPPSPASPTGSGVWPRCPLPTRCAVPSPFVVAFTYTHCDLRRPSCASLHRFVSSVSRPKPETALCVPMLSLTPAGSSASWPASRSSGIRSRTLPKPHRFSCSCTASIKAQHCAACSHSGQHRARYWTDVSLRHCDVRTAVGAPPCNSHIALRPSYVHVVKLND